MTQPVHDTIDFSLMAEETVVNTTVKLTAMISSIIGSDTTDSDFKSSVRGMMNNLISETTIGGEKTPVVWQFSNIVRSSHASGKEEINLIATTRVHEDDNHSLDKRIREVSQEGLSIRSIGADTTPPAIMIEETESKLRLTLLSKAQIELVKINTHTKGGYRLGEVSFENAHDHSTSNTRGGNMMKTAVMSASYGTGFDDSGALGNAVKLTMRANISFRRSV